MLALSTAGIVLAFFGHGLHWDPKVSLSENTDDEMIFRQHFSRVLVPAENPVCHTYYQKVAGCDINCIVIMPCKVFWPHLAEREIICAILKVEVGIGGVDFCLMYFTAPVSQRYGYAICEALYRREVTTYAVYNSHGQHESLSKRVELRVKNVAYIPG